MNTDGSYLPDTNGAGAGWFCRLFQGSLAVKERNQLRYEEFGKPWETLVTVGPIPRHLERADAVARFRLTTGHDFLGVYLHWLGVAANEACPTCDHARMDDDHLLQCTGSMNTRLRRHCPSVLGGSASNAQEAKHGRWINK
ncbi:reverse transcriptase [Trichonephila clavipes]|nr:reverse transcriptase [Trichonephila clavipes]